MECMLYTPLVAGIGDIKGGNKEKVAGLVETLALGSVGKSTMKNFIAKYNTWVQKNKPQGAGHWLHTVDDPNEALTELIDFTSSRCVVHTIQYSTVRGYYEGVSS